MPKKHDPDVFVSVRLWLAGRALSLGGEWFALRGAKSEKEIALVARIVANEILEAMRDE